MSFLDFSLYAALTSGYITRSSIGKELSVATKFRVHLNGYIVPHVDIQAGNPTEAANKVVKNLAAEGHKVTVRKTKVVKEVIDA